MSTPQRAPPSTDLSPDDSPDIFSSTLKPAMFNGSRPTRRGGGVVEHSGKRSEGVAGHADEMDDELGSAAAPAVSESVERATRSMSREPQTLGHGAVLSQGSTASFSSSNFLGSLFSGGTQEQAAKAATSRVQRDPDWVRKGADPGRRKRPTATFGKKRSDLAPAPKTEEVGAKGTATAHPNDAVSRKEAVNIDSDVGSHSSSSGSRKRKESSPPLGASKKPSVRRGGQQFGDLAAEPRKQMGEYYPSEESEEESLKLAMPGSVEKKKKPFINPFESNPVPPKKSLDKEPERPKPKPTYTNPLEKYKQPPPRPTEKKAEKPKTSFKNPLEEYGVPPPRMPIGDSRPRSKPIRDGSSSEGDTEDELLKTHYEKMNLKKSLSQDSARNKKISKDTLEQCGVTDKTAKKPPPIFRNPLEEYNIPARKDPGTGPSAKEALALADKSKPSTPMDLSDSDSDLDLDLDIPVLGLTKKDISSSQPKPPKDPHRDHCKICLAPLPPGFLDDWRSKHAFGKKHILMDDWADICDAHHQHSLDAEWKSKGYPTIDWSALSARCEGLLPTLEKIIHNDLPSGYRKKLEAQVTARNFTAAKVLHSDAELTHAGYYGPRGGSIMLHVVMNRLPRKIEDAASTDAVIARVGVAAFAQSVLVPELAVRLVAEDMSVGEERAKEILGESKEIGMRTNGEERLEDLYEGDTSGWLDIHATQNVKKVVEDDSEEDW